MQSQPHRSARQYRLMVIDGEAEHFLAEGDDLTILFALYVAEKSIADIPPGCSTERVVASDDRSRRPYEGPAAGRVSGYSATLPPGDYQSYFAGLDRIF